MDDSQWAIFGVYKSKYCKEKLEDLMNMPLDSFLELKEYVDVMESYEQAGIKDSMPKEG